MRQRWRLANEEDVKDVASRLRKEDVIEGLAQKGYDIRPWLVSQFTPGNTYVIFNSEGVNVALAGCEHAGNYNGVVWMVATDDLLSHQMEFLKHSKRWIEEVCRPYKIVGNVVHAKNEVHLKWLKWCGFSFTKYHPKMGPLDEPFYEFCKVI